MPRLDPDRLFPTDPNSRALARAYYEQVRHLPIISPHGHTDPRWFAEDQPFSDPAQVFVIPDHYVFRMLFSQGVPLQDLGVPRSDGGAVETDGRKIWALFAQHYFLLRGTPSALWIDHAFAEVFGLEDRFCPATAERFYDHIAACLAQPDFRPRALYHRFNIEVIATTEGALDDLRWHRMIRNSGWSGRVITTYRPDAVVDPEFPGFAENLAQLGAMTGTDCATWAGYLAAHRTRRACFIGFGATASDHGHPNARTENLSQTDAASLFDRVRGGAATPAEADCFRGQMLTEMARMSLQDGLVLQIHPGSWRNHNPMVLAQFGRDKGFDIPTRTDYVAALKPLLDAFGTDPRLSVIVFTLDETTLSAASHPATTAPSHETGR